MWPCSVASRSTSGQQTSDANIYAAGDCIALTHLLTGKDTHTPLGSLANREGRIVADNMAGRPALFHGVLGSFIMKAFERCIASTGLTLEAARVEGFDADCALTAPADRAHFFPDPRGGHPPTRLRPAFPAGARPAGPSA